MKNANKCIGKICIFVFFFVHFKNERSENVVLYITYFSETVVDRNILTDKTLHGTGKFLILLYYCLYILSKQTYNFSIEYFTIFLHS